MDIVMERVEIARINPAVYNPRIDLKPGDVEYQRLKKSMQQFGCVVFLVWNKRSGNLVSGHQRLKILIELGAQEVDVVVVDLPAHLEKSLNLALNKISGDWDQSKLATLLDDLIVSAPEFDFELTGFELSEAQELILDFKDPLSDEEDFDADALPDTSKPAITQRGELLVLGNHRLLCGDSTSAEDVRKLMENQRAMLFATDPPYLVDYDPGNHDLSRRKKKSSSLTWDKERTQPDLHEKFCQVAVAEAITKNAAWYCWYASTKHTLVESAWIKAGAFVHQQIIWCKSNALPGHAWYGWMHEPCFFGWVRPNQPERMSDEKLPTVWQTTSSSKGIDHPTSKPIELFAIPMRQHTRPGDLCYEPFCGSGSQLIAAERLERRCYAMEISPHYCDLIVRRWIACVGQKAPTALRARYAEQAVAA